MTTRYLLMLRHAEAEATRPGHRDLQRRLTEHGLAQAAAAGHWLTEHYRVDAVLCSPAIRTRETLAELGVGAPAEFPDWPEAVVLDTDGTIEQTLDRARRILSISESDPSSRWQPSER